MLRPLDFVITEFYCMKKIVRTPRDHRTGPRAVPMRSCDGIIQRADSTISEIVDDRLFDKILEAATPVGIRKITR